MSVDERWKTLASNPCFAGELIAMDINQFAMYVNTNDMKAFAIYNVHENKWKVIKLESEQYLDESRYRWMFSEHTNTFYATAHGDFPMIAYDLSDKIMVEYDEQVELGIYDIDYPQLVNVDGEIHLIGGLTDNGHGVWDGVWECWGRLNKLPFVNDSTAIYLPKERKILLIGYGEKNYSIWKYDTDTLELEDLKIDLRKPMDVAGVVLTSDQNYVIFTTWNTKYFYVLNIKNPDSYKLFRSRIKKPFDDCYEIVGTGGVQHELLVMGYIRLLYESAEFKNSKKKSKLCPIDLQKLIIKAFSEEEIHCIGDKENVHYAICVNDILSSLKKIKTKKRKRKS